MKIQPFILLLALTHFNVLAQVNTKRIQVSEDLELIPLSENAYIHQSVSDLPAYGKVSSNGLILIEKNQAFLFDTPATDSLTATLLSWMKLKMGLQVVGFIPNHWHEDCMGGLGYLQKMGIKSYANKKTIELAKTKKLPIPEIGFQDSLKLSLGSTVIECFYFGPAHSSDNIVVWIPSEKLLFAGCMIKSKTSNNLGNTSDGDINAYLNTINHVANKFPKAKIVLPGHGPYGGLDLILHTQKLAGKK